jgi:PAS domain S-box-containing protein
MHPYVLLPLAALVAAGVLASAFAAREPDQRANRLASLILVCAAFWSFCELMATIAPDAETALTWLRWTALGSIPTGPVLLHIAMVAADARRRDQRGILVFTYTAAIGAALISVSTDLVWTAAVKTDWGWGGVPGPVLGGSFAITASVPAIAITGTLLRPARPLPLTRGQFALVLLLGSVGLGVGGYTDGLRPLLGTPVPRLGHVGVVLLGVILWPLVFRMREPRLTPQQFAREILDTLTDGVALLRLDGRIRTTNPALAALTGRPVQELVGMPLAELLVDGGSDADPDAERECQLRHASGALIPVAVSRVQVQEPRGQPLGQVVALRDLRELIALRNRLVSSGRLAAMGQLAGGIAHEINNPISYVRSNLGLLRQHWVRLVEILAKGPDPVREALDRGPLLLAAAGQGVDRVASIVRDVRGFSAVGSGEPEAADLHELMDRAIRVAAPRLSGARLERDDAPLPLVPCVPHEVMQVFLDLVLTAARGLGGSGTIRVSTRRENGAAVVTVADDGPGLDAAARQRIFEPFASAAAVEEGAGLGLAISQHIVTRHGGELWVDSEPGQGTRFRVSLPLAAQPVEAA